VIQNIPVGGENATHYKLTFEAQKMRGARPGQFIMMDTRPREQTLKPYTVQEEDLESSVERVPRAFLKRPFGIHRAFYPGFEKDYLKNLALPPSLAAALHTVLPHQFDIFYKVLENGVGTREMRKLKPKDQIHMIAPLGKPFIVRNLRRDGIREVHVIGGGVGMAPLVFFVQALRFYAFQVRAFIGVGEIQLLRYRSSDDAGYEKSDALAGSFGEKTEDAYVYVDDLLAAGLRPEDIFVSCDNKKPLDLKGKIPKRNLHEGFVSKQYGQYLESKRDKRSENEFHHIASFACGPMKMMEKVWEVAKQNGIHLRVLMEKRMACGIGVCLSCVCKTTDSDGKIEYTRVCTEGPVFDAGKIVWETET
jgi:NAD(P)H-flavin reductase